MTSRSTEDFLSDLRDYLKKIRLESGFTQAEFAEKGGNQHQSIIARLEAGRSPNMGIRVLYEITRGTPVPLWQIIKKAECDGGKTKDSEWSELQSRIENLPPKKQKTFVELMNHVLSWSSAK